MFFKDDDGQQALVLAFVFALVALVVSSVIGLAIQTAFDTGISAAGNSGAGKSFSKSDQSKTTAAPPVATGSSTTAGPTSEALAATNAEAAQAASDAASIRVESGAVKFYFASGRAELAPASAAVLADFIADAQSGRKLVISGFHDATGDPVRNAELARQRALAVSTLLRASGVSAQQIELSKPQQAKQEESDAEARRVEVRLQ